MKKETSNRLPNWAVLAIAIVVGLTVYYASTRKSALPVETVIKTQVQTKTVTRDSIVTVIKNNSTAGSKKGDSLVNLLKHEPWKLSNQDMKDSTVVNFLKNYRYE